MREIALIVTTMVVALIVVLQLRAGPVDKSADAAVSMDPHRLHLELAAGLRTESYDAF